MGCREATAKGTVLPKEETRERMGRYEESEGVDTAESMDHQLATAPALFPVQTSDTESPVNITILT